MGFLQKFIANPNGVLGVVVMAIALFNLTMASLVKMFTILKKQEPQWMQKLGSVGLAISQWLSANTPTPPPIHPAPPQPNDGEGN